MSDFLQDVLLTEEMCQTSCLISSPGQDRLPGWGQSNISKRPSNMRSVEKGVSTYRERWRLAPQLTECSLQLMLLSTASFARHCMPWVIYSLHMGFIHSDSPLPFVYDLADLYKENLCIDFAFSLTREIAGRYEKALVSSRFRERVIELNLLASVARDIPQIFGDVSIDVYSTS